MRVEKIGNDINYTTRPISLSFCGQKRMKSHGYRWLDNNFHCELSILGGVGEPLTS